MFMCFEVVVVHGWNLTGPGFLHLFGVLCPYAVPVFMFMSFFLMQEHFLKKDKNYAFKRIWHLIIPQIVWALVYFVVFGIVGKIRNIQTVNVLSDLFWQIFIGYSPRLNPAMWFQMNLIFISILFFVIFYFFDERKGLIIVVVISLLCIFLQYSEINYMLLINQRSEIKETIGRLVDMIPIATFGLCASRYGLMKLFKKKTLLNMVISCILTILFIALEHRVLKVEHGFSYAGIWLPLIAWSINSFAYQLNLLVEKYSSTINFITKHTSGIYYSHLLILFCMFNTITFKTQTFIECILVYIVGFAMCEILENIPLKWVRYII